MRFTRAMEIAHDFRARVESALGKRRSLRAAFRALACLALALTLAGPARAADDITLSDPLMRVTLHLARCTVDLSTAHGFTSAGDLWTVRIADRVVRSRDFGATVVRSTASDLEVEVRDRAGVGLHGRLSLRLAQGRLSTRLTFDAKASRLEVAFPILQNVRQLGGADLAYCFPRCGALVNHIPIAVRESRGGRLPLQFMDAGTEQGGLAVFTRARDDRGFSYRLEKRTAITMAVESDSTPNRAFVSVPVEIRAHAGDWHVAFDDYRAWLATWFRAAAPPKAWFRGAFTLRQQFLRSSSFGDGTYFRDGRLTFREGLAADALAFGGIDMLHLFDWGASQTRGRVGSYDAWSEIGGLQPFRAALHEVAVPVGLYLEGYLVDRAAPLAPRTSRWQLRDARGRPASPFPPALAMCPAVPEWRAWLAATYARVQRETGATAFYVDEVGLADGLRVCHSPKHGHPAPSVPLAGEHLLLRDLRRAVGPHAALYTEETPADVAAQEVDGSFTYSVMSADQRWSPSHVNLTRFALPQLKTFEILTGDTPVGDRLDLVSATFFNGEGIWLMGPSQSAFSPRVRAYIRHMRKVMRTHLDCFTSSRVTPLVPCKPLSVFANEFRGNGRIIYTLHNPTSTTIRAVTLPLAPSSARWQDAWNDRAVFARRAGGGSEVHVVLEPHSVTCVTMTLPIKAGPTASR